MIRKASSKEKQIDQEVDGTRLVGSELMLCPVCGKTHIVEKRLDPSFSVVLKKDNEIVRRMPYGEVFYRCSKVPYGCVSDFETRSLQKENLLRCRKTYFLR